MISPYYAIILTVVKDKMFTIYLIINEVIKLYIVKPIVKICIWCVSGVPSKSGKYAEKKNETGVYISNLDVSKFRIIERKLVANLQTLLA